MGLRKTRKISGCGFDPQPVGRDRFISRPVAHARTARASERACSMRASKPNGRTRFHSCATHLNFIQRSARASLLAYRSTFLSIAVSCSLSKLPPRFKRDLSLRKCLRTEFETASWKVPVNLATVTCNSCPILKFISDKSKVLFLRTRAVSTV